MKNIIFLSLVTLCLLVSCNPFKDSNNCERDYLFAIPVTLSPAIDTFSIGDTIQISMSFPKKMEDQNSGERFDMSSFPFNTEIILAKIDQNPAKSADAIVEYQAIQGTINELPLTGGGRAIQVRFNQDTDSLFFSCRIIFNSEGVLAVNYASYFLEEFNDEIKVGCKTESVDIGYPLILKALLNPSI